MTPAAFPARRRVRLVADDLTGTLDSAVQFTGVADVAVVRDPGAGDAARSLAFNLASRDGSRADAVAATLAAAGFLRGADVAFKKIDSLLRGHWAAEIAALVGASAFASIVLAPAFPAQGRVTRGGRQFWHAPDHGWRPVEVDIAAALAAEGLTTCGADGPARPGAVRVLDAETEDDLAAVAAMGEGLARPILWCGAAGLARAVAGAPPRQVAGGSRPHLTLIGSNHPVSHAQLAHLGARAAGVVLRCGPDDPSGAGRIDAALAEHGRCVALADLPHGTDPAAAARRIAAWLHATLRAIAPPATLSVVGGETLAAVCAALDVDGLDIRGEVSPGVPCSTLIGGPWNGVVCFSKSGAFGGADWLTSHLG